MPVRLFALALIGASVIAATAFAGDFDGTYTGKRALTKGNDPTCPKEDNVSVTIDGDVLTFTDSTLHDSPVGLEPHPDGTFNVQHMEMGGRTVGIRGRIIGNAIDADVINAPCEYHWHVEKK